MQIINLKFSRIFAEISVIEKFRQTQHNGKKNVSFDERRYKIVRLPSE